MLAISSAQPRIIISISTIILTRIDTYPCIVLSIRIYFNWAQWCAKCCSWISPGIIIANSNTSLIYLASKVVVRACLSADMQEHVSIGVLVDGALSHA